MGESGLQDFNRRWLSAWSARDIPHLLTFYTEDLFYCDAAVPVGVTGKAALTRYFEQNFQAMGRVHFHIDAFWAVPEGFFCRWFADVEGDSRRLRGLDYVQLEGGLIARNELFTHWLAAASAHHD